MAKDFFDERKVHSTDIVNGVARKDIFDGKGTLLVKEGTRIGEAHYERMRQEGLIQEDLNNNKDRSSLNHDINYVSSKSLHGRLDKLITIYAKFQHKVIFEPDSSAKDELTIIADKFKQLCDENIFQVLGELHISEISNYRFTKPLYITASLIELIKRYNQFKKQQVINQNDIVNLIYAALLYNIGLLQLEKNISANNKILTPQERQTLRKNYPAQSLSIMQKIGFTAPVCIDAVKHHNIASNNPSFEAQLLRTPFIYTGIAMPQFASINSTNMFNPSREFAQLFAHKQLDPVLGGLFLKINGLAPIGSIMLFSSREKAMVIAGPDEGNISSSKLRMLTNRSGLQLRRPGEIFYLHKTALTQKGLTDHHSFAWSKFAPFTMWER